VATRTVGRWTGGLDGWSTGELEAEPIFPAKTSRSEPQEAPRQPAEPDDLIHLYARIACFRAVPEMTEEGNWYASVGLGCWSDARCGYR
jgi:hypothetical protein